MATKGTAPLQFSRFTEQHWCSEDDFQNIELPNAEPPCIPIRLAAYVDMPFDQIPMERLRTAVEWYRSMSPDAYDNFLTVSTSLHRGDRRWGTSSLSTARAAERLCMRARA